MPDSATLDTPPAGFSYAADDPGAAPEGFQYADDPTTPDGFSGVDESQPSLTISAEPGSLGQTAINPSGLPAQVEPVASTNPASGMPELADPSQTSAFGAAVRSGVENVIPTAVGLATATGGALAGLFTGPGAVVASPTFAIGGGLAGGKVTSKIQDSVLKKILPEKAYEDWKKLRAEDEKKHAVSNFLGGFIPQAVAFRPSPTNVAKAIGEAGSIVKNPATYIAALKAKTPKVVEGFNNLINVSLGAGVGGAEPVYDAITSKDHDWMKAAIAFGLGATLNKPSSIGKKLSFHNTLEAAMNRLGAKTKPSPNPVTPKPTETAVPAADKTPPIIIPKLSPLQKYNASQREITAQALKATAELQAQAEEIAQTAPATASALAKSGKESIARTAEAKQQQIEKETLSNEQASQEAEKQTASAAEQVPVAEPEPEAVQPVTPEPRVDEQVAGSEPVQPSGEAEAKPAVEAPVEPEKVPEPEPTPNEDAAMDALTEDIYASNLPIGEKQRLGRQVSPDNLDEVRASFEATKKTYDAAQATAEPKGKTITGERVRGGVLMREEKPEFIQGLKGLEEKAEPEHLAAADEASKQAAPYFESKRNMLSERLSGYQRIPGAEDPASKIIDAANLRLREQAIQGKKVAASTILDSVTKDFVRQAEARKAAGFRAESTDATIGNGESDLTVGDTLSSEASPEEVSRVAADVQESINRLIPSLEPQEKGVLKAVLSGTFETVGKTRAAAKAIGIEAETLMDSAHSVYKKIAKQFDADGIHGEDRSLAMQAIKEGRINYAEEIQTSDGGRVQRGSEGAARSQTGQSGTETRTEGAGRQGTEGAGDANRPVNQPRVSLSEQLGARQIVKFVKGLPEYIHDAFNKRMEAFRRLGITPDRFKIIENGVDQDGKSMIGLSRTSDFVSDWSVTYDELGRKYLVFNKDVFGKNAERLSALDGHSVINEELNHVAFFEALRRTWNAKEDPKFSTHINREIGKIVDEAQSLRSVLGEDGKNLLDDAQRIYGTDVEKANAAIELIRHITQARGDEARAISEQFRNPGAFKTIKAYIRQLLDVFKKLPQTSAIRQIVEQTEALLRGEPYNATKATGPPEAPEPQLASVAGAPKSEEDTAAKLWNEQGTNSPFFKSWFTGETVQAPTQKEIDSLRLNDADKPSFVRPAGASMKDTWEATKKLSKDVLDDASGIRPHTDLKKSLIEYGAKMQQNVQQVGNLLKELHAKVRDPIRQDAITIYREAGGDEAVIADQLSKTKGKEAKKAYEAALKLTPEEKTIAQDITEAFKNAREKAIAYGIPINELENYAPHIWKKDAVKEFLRTASTKGLSTSLKYAKARKLATYFEGEQLGFQPETKSAFAGLGAYLNDLNHVIAAREFVADLAKGKASDDRPLLNAKTSPGAFKTVDKGPAGEVHLINPDVTGKDISDYKNIDKQAFHQWSWIGKDSDGKPIFFRSDSVLHPEAFHEIQNVLSNSSFRDLLNSPSQNVGARAAKGAAKFLLQDVQSYGKATMFGLFSPFHAVQEATHALGHAVNPFSKIKTPDLSDPKTFDKAAHGLMLGPDRISQDQFMEGLSNVDKDLSIKLLSKIPAIGPRIRAMSQAWQEWLFHTYIPALKEKSYDIILERNRERFKDLSDDQVKYLTADQVNNGYGHLNYMDRNRNATLQHTFQLFALAPDFLEARLRHAAQAGQALASMAIHPTKTPIHLEQLRSMAALTVGLYTAARVGNALLNDGDSKMDHPFSIVKGNREYTIRNAPEDIAKAFTQTRMFLNGRFAPIPRAALQGLTGVNYRGEATDFGDVIKDFLAGNAPIPAQPLLRGLSSTTKNNPISPLEQVLSGLGVKVSRFSPINEVYPVAHDWLAKNWQEQGLKQPDKAKYPTSKYQQLKFALDDGDYDKAWQEWQKLNAETKDTLKLERGLKESIMTPFTGSERGDALFAKSLDARDRQTYDAAVARRVNMLQRYGKMWQLEHARQAEEKMAKK